MKKVTLTENSLKKLVKESVKQVLKESEEREEQVFNEVMECIIGSHHRVGYVEDCDRMVVTYDDEPKFTTQGYNLGYNIYRLGKLLNDTGELD